MTKGLSEAAQGAYPKKDGCVTLDKNVRKNGFFGRFFHKKTDKLASLIPEKTDKESRIFVHLDVKKPTTIFSKNYIVYRNTFLYPYFYIFFIFSIQTNKNKKIYLFNSTANSRRYAILVTFFCTFQMPKSRFFGIFRCYFDVFCARFCV